MRRFCLLTLVFLAANVYAQEGMIRYAGTQTTKMDFDALMANAPAGMELDSSMVEMILAQMPEEGFSNPMDWETWFSGKTVLTKMIVPDFMQSMGGGGAPGITPFSGGAGGAGADMSKGNLFQLRRRFDGAGPALITWLSHT